GAGENESPEAPGPHRETGLFAQQAEHALLISDLGAPRHRRTQMPRSLWGWGQADQLPDLKETAARVAPLVGEVGAEVPAREIRVPERRVEVPSALSGLCASDDRARASHCWGKSYV